MIRQVPFRSLCETRTEHWVQNTHECHQTCTAASQVDSMMGFDILVSKYSALESIRLLAYILLVAPLDPRALEGKTNSTSE